MLQVSNISTAMNTMGHGLPSVTGVKNRVFHESQTRMGNLLIKTCLSIFLILGVVSVVSAQSFKPVPNFLKGEKQINLTFDYSQVKFGKNSQAQWYEKKGKEWVEAWEGRRRDDIANSFIAYINAELNMLGMEAGNHPDAQYTMIVEVLMCDFGHFAVISNKPANVKATVKIVKTGTTQALASTTMTKRQNRFTAEATPVDFDRLNLAIRQVGQDTGRVLVKILQ